MVLKFSEMAFKFHCLEFNYANWKCLQSFALSNKNKKLNKTSRAKFDILFAKINHYDLIFCSAMYIFYFFVLFKTSRCQVNKCRCDTVSKFCTLRSYTNGIRTYIFRIKQNQSTSQKRFCGFCGSFLITSERTVGR